MPSAHVSRDRLKRHRRRVTERYYDDGRLRTQSLHITQYRV